MLCYYLVLVLLHLSYLEAWVVVFLCVLFCVFVLDEQRE
jgi:hypothetical protein